MTARVRGVLAGLAAILVLAGIVVGLPVLLYRLGGSPLPRHLTSWHHLAGALSSRDDGSMLLGAIRDCSWLGWLLFSCTVLAEAQAVARGQTNMRFRLGGLQSFAARLVALAALTFAAAPALTLTASAAVVSAEHGATLPTSDPARATAAGPAGSGAMATPAAGDTEAASATRLVTVRTGDCLWSLAQRYLGSGERYPEIASLNYGRVMADGQVFTSPSLIEPGWLLLLPPRSDTGGTHPSGSGAGSSEDAGTAAGGRAASEHLGHASADPHYRRRHPAAHRLRARSAGGHVPGRGSGTGRADGEPGETSAVGGSSLAEQAGDLRSATGVVTGDQLPAVGAFATGALAGSIMTSLNVLRRRQRLERRGGRRIALPAEPEVKAVEQQLRAAAPAEAPGTLQDALACLESAITAAGQMMPDIIGLHVTPAVLEVLLSAPAADSPPPPYRISPARQGMCWQLDPAALGGAQERGGCHLLPGLFTAGATADGYLLLDLEALQVTGCDGPPDLVDRVITTAAIELATGRWAGWYELILVGCDEMEAVGRAEHASGLDEALTLIEGRREAARRRLAGPAADVRQLRLAAPDDEDWALIVLVSRIEPSPAQLQRLIDLAEQGLGGVAGLLAGDVETPAGRMAPTVLQLAPDPHEPGEIIANVVPLQITVRPRVLSSADYRAITTLFSVAADTSDVSRDAPAYASCSAPAWIPQSAGDSGGLPWEHSPGLPALADVADVPEPTDQDTGPRHAATCRLQIQVLGPFVISGAEEQLQPKQAELVLALALSAPAGLANSALGNLLGPDPDHPKPADAVRQVIARARRRLGLATDGQEYIRHTGNGNYVLHPEVSLDWTEFRALASAGDADALRAAVGLIRGQPFTGSYFWWIDIPLLETVRAELVDAAVTLAELELAAGSAREAARAARAGLRAEASAEQLWRVLMRAEYAAGNLAGVGEAWRACLDSIEDVSPDGDPHPDTEALYHQLTSAARQHAQVRS